MSRGADTGGIATALKMLGVDGHVPSDDAEQQAMFEDDAAMPAMMAPATPSPAKVGRPVGSRNKSTEAMLSLFLSKFRHPMMVLGEMYSRTPEQLARELKLYKIHEGAVVLNPILDANGVHLKDEDGNLRWERMLATGEAADMQQKAAISLLPYTAKKQPIQIETPGDNVGFFIIGDIGVQGSSGSDDQLPIVDVTPNDEGQQ